MLKEDREDLQSNDFQTLWQGVLSMSAELVARERAWYRQFGSGNAEEHGRLQARLRQIVVE